MISIIPSLYLSDLKAAINFYKNAFGAVERWKIENEDGSIHVAELMIENVFIRLHQEKPGDGNVGPLSAKATTVVFGLLSSNPDRLAAQAVKAGAKLLSPIKDYEYGYRQGTVIDPFGHHWCLEGLHALREKPSFAK